MLVLGQSKVIGLSYILDLLEVLLHVFSLPSLAQTFV